MTKSISLLLRQVLRDIPSVDMLFFHTTTAHQLATEVIGQKQLAVTVCGETIGISFLL